MPEAVVSPLVMWGSFCTIIGSAAAALMGLMFVVITLIAGIERSRGSGDGIAAFGTPNVVHFCSALLIAVTLSAPWPALWQTGLVLGLAGLAGVAYIGIILRRTRRQTDYEPVLEDWLWHIILPMICYTGLVVAAILLAAFPEPDLFGIATVAILFLFIGIHNAWDTVTYMAFQQSQQDINHQE